MDENTPKIGLALGGGGVRAFIHIGFYEVLRENNVPIACIAGTSMGAIVGAGMALGYEPEKLKAFAQSYQHLDMFSWKHFNFFNESLVKGEVINKILDEFFGSSNFENLNIPFKCTSVNLESREEVILDKGLISKAVQASSAYPTVFPPVFYNNQYLIDGVIIDPVPAHLVRAMGADKIIAIRIKNDMVRQYISGQIYMKHYKPRFGKHLQKKSMGFFGKKKSDFKLLVDILIESLSIASECNVQRTIADAKPDIFIEPVVNVGWLDFSKVDELIEQGRKMALDIMPQINEWLGRGITDRTNP